MRIHSYMMWGAIVLAGCSAGTEPDAFATLGVAGDDGPLGSGGVSDDGDGPGGSSAGDQGTDGGTTADPDGGPGASEGASVGDSEGGSDTGGGGGSGTVDATAFPSIQDAIDSLEGIGGAVYIPAGTHFIPEKLKVYSNITVFGAGMDQTIIRFEPGVPDDDMISNDSSSGFENIVIRDLTLQGNGLDDGVHYGLKFRNVRDSFVIGVSSRDHGRDGFYFGHVDMDDVLMGVYQTRLSGCHASGNGRNGLSIVQGDDNIVDGCTFEGNNTWEHVSAIDLEPDPYPNGFVRRNRILSNVVRNNPNNGIQMWAAGDAIVAENAICYNSIENNAGTGIADHQSDDDVFVGNMFSGNGAEADYDGSAKVGDQFAELCGPDLAPLPPVPPLP
jgi:parallel beta-helix repeat protein